MIHKGILDFILLGTQILTLIALILYVIKTWEIASATRKAAEVSAQSLQEMEEARDQELAPYIVVYFDIPHGEHLVYLVIKNIGRSIATNLKIEISPALIGPSGKDFSKLPMIKDGIPSLPPNHELRTFIDTTMAFLNEKNNRALTYLARIVYFGGIKQIPRSSEQMLDLTAYKGLSSISRRGENELVTEVEKIAKSAEQIGSELDDVKNALFHGIYLRNPVINTVNLQQDYLSWRKMVLSKSLEFKFLWTSFYGANQERLIEPFIINLQTRLILIGDDFLVMAASCPIEVEAGLRDSLIDIAGRLAELSTTRFYMDGGRSVSSFDNKGNEILGIIEQLIIKFQKSSRADG